MGVCETVRATGDEMALRRERPHTPTTCCAYDAGCLAQAANYGLKLTKLTSLGFIRLKPDTLDGRGNRDANLERRPNSHPSRWSNRRGGHCSGSHRVC